MRGKKGVPHRDPQDPPRRRANQATGHGTWDTDRPPVRGVTGRRGGRLALRVGRRNWAAELVHRTVVPRTKPGAMVYTDEWAGYKPLPAAGRGHAAVKHNAGEWVSVSVRMGTTFSGQWEPPERLRRDPIDRGLHRRPESELARPPGLRPLRGS